MIPIKDARGRVVGFTGRVVGKGEPKYLNTGETELFTKRSILFGMDVAFKPAKERKQIIGFIISCIELVKRQQFLIVCEFFIRWISYNNIIFRIEIMCQKISIDEIEFELFRQF